MTQEISPNQSQAEKTKVPQLLTLLQDVMLVLEDARTAEAAFTYALAHICRFMNWPLAHVYIWSDAANAFVSSKVWYEAHAGDFDSFRSLS